MSGVPKFKLLDPDHSHYSWGSLLFRDYMVQHLKTNFNQTINMILAPNI